MKVQIKELARYYSDDKQKTAIIELLNEYGNETLQVHCYAETQHGHRDHTILIAKHMAQASHLAEDFVYGVLRG
ncbi:hypothetical protein EBR43_01825 [bacterium]|nr:hypothetical protein [bacterium]